MSWDSFEEYEARRRARLAAAWAELKVARGDLAQLRVDGAGMEALWQAEQRVHAAERRVDREGYSE